MGATRKHGPHYLLGEQWVSVKRIDDTDSPYTVTDDDYVIECNTTSGAITVNLPPLADCKKQDVNRQLGFKVVGGTSAVTIDANASEEIDGSTTLSLSADNDMEWLIAGTDDWLRSSNPPSLQTADLAAGILSADATGRALMATSYFTEAHVDTAFAAASIDDNILKSLSTTRLMGGRDIGRLPIGYFYLTAAVSDTETVTINGRSYEFDNDSTSTGDVAVDVTGDLTADNACTALAAAINADGSATVEAVVMAGNADTNAGVMLVGTAASASNQTLATDCAAGVVSAANTTNAAALTNRDLFFQEYAVTTADVTQLATTGGNSIIVAGVPTTTAPTLLNVFVRTSAGACKPLVATLSFIVLQVNSNFYCVTCDDGAATLANGDTIGITLAL